MTIVPVSRHHHEPMSHERRVFVDDLISSGCEISPKDKDLHHLERVLRLKVGDAVTVVDGNQRSYRATVSQNGPLKLCIHGPLKSDCREASDLTAQCPISRIICGLPKGPASDAIVEGATECGVANITFWQAARSIPTDGENRLRRWGQIAESAAKQSGQLFVPKVTWEPTLTSALRDLPPLHSSRFLCSLSDDASPLATLPRSEHPDWVVAFGPEGDMTLEEDLTLRSQGFIPVTLGSSRLRCQTAVISAIAGAYALWLGRHQKGKVEGSIS